MHSCHWNSAVRSAALALLAGPLLACASSNLVVNGSFDDRTDPLTGWKFKYDPSQDKNAGWYVDNDKHVSVVADGAQKSVLALWGDIAILQVPGQGTKVDSAPIAVDMKHHYRFTVHARTTGPGSRILLEGYGWRPGIKPHANPTLNELRKCYKFSLLYFGDAQEGSRSAVGPAWKRASMTFPDRTKSQLQEDLLNKVTFVVIHIVAIDGSEGYLYVDDVSLEKAD